MASEGCGTSIYHLWTTGRSGVDELLHHHDPDQMVQMLGHRSTSLVCLILDYFLDGFTGIELTWNTMLSS